MKYLFICFIFLFGTACNVFCQSIGFSPKYSTILHPEKGEMLLKQRSRMRHQGVQSFFLLQQKEIDVLERNFMKIFLITPENRYNEDVKISSLDKYGFQYMGVVIDGDKFIYINAFWLLEDEKGRCYFSDWKSTPINVFDGGHGFWGALFSLKREVFSKLYVNVPR